jgi:hypothetical protein
MNKLGYQLLDENELALVGKWAALLLGKYRKHISDYAATFVMGTAEYRH